MFKNWSEWTLGWGRGAESSYLGALQQIRSNTLEGEKIDLSDTGAQILIISRRQL